MNRLQGRIMEGLNVRLHLLLFFHRQLGDIEDFSQRTESNYSNDCAYQSGSRI